jgi:hypothetical protein
LFDPGNSDVWKVAALALVAVMSAEPATAQEPWEGLWLNTDHYCQDEMAREKAVRITRSEINAAEYVCRIVKTTKSGKATWNLALRCTEGGPEQAAAQSFMVPRPELLVRRDKSGTQEVMARCENLSPATLVAIRERRKFLGCEGLGCRLTAVEWNNLDSAIAWAIGKPNAEDADHACLIEQKLPKGSAASQSCVKEQLAKPPTKVTANCLDGITSVSGSLYKITDAAREGALRSGDTPGFWDATKPYGVPSPSRISMMATWFHVLCPTKSMEWNISPLN